MPDYYFEGDNKLKLADVVKDNPMDTNPDIDMGNIPNQTSVPGQEGVPQSLENYVSYQKYLQEKTAKSPWLGLAEGFLGVAIPSVLGGIATAKSGEGYGVGAAQGGLEGWQNVMKNYNSEAGKNRLHQIASSAAFPEGAELNPYGTSELGQLIMIHGGDRRAALEELWRQKIMRAHASATPPPSGTTDIYKYTPTSFWERFFKGAPEYKAEPVKTTKTQKKRGQKTPESQIEPDLNIKANKGKRKTDSFWNN